MKQNKGEAAFESVDEVLAEKIVVNSQEHVHAESSESPSVPPPPPDTPAQDIAAKTGKPLSGRLIAAVAITLLAVMIGILYFVKTRKSP